MKEKKRILILSLISLFVFILTFVFAISGKISVDYSISNSIAKIWSSPTNGFFIFLGKYSLSIMIGIAIVISIFLYLQKRKKQSLIFVFTLMTGYILEKSIKLIVQRDRPLSQLFHETGYSFPSGHTVFSIILFSMLIYFYKDEIKNKAAKYFFVAVNVFLILLVGFSRIYLNVHWFTDVVGGYALGFFLTSLGVLWLKKIHKRVVSKKIPTKTL